MAVTGIAVLGLLLFLVVPVAVLVVVLVLVARSARRPGVEVPGAEVPVRDAPAAYRRALGHARTTAWTSWLLLVVAAVAVALVAARVPGGLPPESAYAVPVTAAGLAFLAACATGEITWPHPAGSLRRAPLLVRTAATVAPVRLRRTVWGWAALLAATLLVTGLAGTPDGLELTVRYPEGVTATASPFPGWRYGVALAVAVALVVAACESVLRLVARRPAVADTSPEDDQRLRRVSARRMLAGVQLVLALAAGAVLVIASNAAHSVSTASWGSTVGLTTTQTTQLHEGAFVLAVLAAALALASFVGGVAVAVVALARAAAEAGQPVTPPPAAGGIEPAGAPS